MRKHMGILSILPLFLFTACATSSQVSTPEQTAAPQPAQQTKPAKHPLDQSEYRRFVLDNGIKVLLVTDPRFNKSAASLVVDAGALSDPPEREGLAHFLEHMLFMGTEKYPGVDEYAQYITENGGNRNAYTSRDHTNYIFEIKHDAFEGAVDRLAQFFIAPLFTNTYTEREINAVNSEFQSYIENDNWRASQVQRAIFRKDHPAFKFNVGSQKTLGDIKRDELLAFHKAHYGAHRMSLVLLGNAPLDTLQHLAKTYFVPIESRNLAPITYEPDFLPEKETFRLVQIEPIKDTRTVELSFPMPSYINDFRSKPDALLSSMIGHEGKGSLLSLLKTEGLATSLSAGGWLETRDYGRLEINVNLTPKGLENYLDVVRHCLAYIDILKESDYPTYYFQELRSKAKLDELYTDRGEGFGYASALGRRLAQYPLDVVERLPYLYEEEDAQAYHRLVSYLRPNNMMVTLMDKGVTTDKTEPHYGTQYSTTEDDAVYATLSNLPAREGLHLPEPNPFMPKHTTIPNRPQKEGITPTKLLSEPGVELYHATDAEFLRPKVSLRYKIRFAKENMNLRFKVLLDTYTTCVNESLTELAYPASLAGLDYTFQNGYEGVYFSINGFDESAATLYENVLEHMQHINITEQTFEAIKDRSIRSLKNFPKQDAWRITRSLIYETLYAVSYTPAERLSVVETLTLADIHAFAKTFYAQGYVEALVYGNLPTHSAIILTKQMQQKLGLQPIARDVTFEQTYLRQEKPEAIQVVTKLEVNNSCFWRQYYADLLTPQSRAAGLILGTFIERPFFTELRSNQQLGYIVSGGMSALERTSMYAYFLIQSNDYPADEVENRADAFIATYVDLFNAMPPEQFETLRATAIEELEQKDKTISEKASKFNAQAFSYNGNFKRDQEAIDALQAISVEDVAALLKNTLSPETRRMRTVLSFARDHEAKAEIKSSFDDLNTWKKGRTFK
jgi:insulysin